MDILEAIILGIFQGITEFLPVSSSGHLEVFNDFLGKELEESFMFSITVHFATVLSTIIVFWKYVREMLSSIFALSWDEASQFAFKMLISNIPLALVGLFFGREFLMLFNSSAILVGFMFIINGTFLFIIHKSHLTHNKNISFWHPLLIGIVQVLALAPGISRSGTTLATALALGIKKKQAIVFSFLMITGPIIFFSFIEIYRYMTGSIEAGQFDLVTTGAGFLSAFVTGLLVCKLMITIVEKWSLGIFAYYCWAVGILIAGYWLFNNNLRFDTDRIFWESFIYQNGQDTPEDEIPAPILIDTTSQSDSTASLLEPTEHVALEQLLNQLASLDLPLEKKEQVSEELQEQFESMSVLVKVLDKDRESSIIYKAEGYLNRIQLLRKYKIEVIEIERNPQGLIKRLTLREL